MMMIVIKSAYCCDRNLLVEIQIIELSLKLNCSGEIHRLYDGSMYNTCSPWKGKNKFLTHIYIFGTTEEK